METMTKREAVHTLLDQVPEDELDDIVEFLACRGINGTDLSATAIRERAGLLDPAPEQAAAFWREYGPLMGPPDGEG